MLRKVTLSIREVEANDILAEDIFSDYRLLAKKGFSVNGANYCFT
ncbi:hypothetical protein OL548_27680 [Lysinibacillus sp. MHQ-1]|nr:hypothetical protein OL548_27680 [Lysinibacillus sp. MHQ-1]